MYSEGDNACVQHTSDLVTYFIIWSLFSQTYSNDPQ